MIHFPLIDEDDGSVCSLGDNSLVCIPIHSAHIRQFSSPTTDVFAWTSSKTCLTVSRFPGLKQSTLDEIGQVTFPVPAKLFQDEHPDPLPPPEPPPASSLVSLMDPLFVLFVSSHDWHPAPAIHDCALTTQVGNCCCVKESSLQWGVTEITQCQFACKQWHLCLCVGAPLSHPEGMIGLPKTSRGASEVTWNRAMQWCFPWSNGHLEPCNGLKWTPFHPQCSHGLHCFQITAKAVKGCLPLAGATHTVR